MYSHLCDQTFVACLAFASRRYVQQQKLTSAIAAALDQTPSPIEERLLQTPPHSSDATALREGVMQLQAARLRVWSVWKATLASQP